jgi:hypothetical protein
LLPEETLQDSNYPPPPPPPPPYAPPPAYPPPPPQVYGQAANPYAAPAASYAAAPSGSLAEAEQVRHELLKHEASIRSIGMLYIVGAILFAIGTAGFLLALALGSSSGPAVADGGLAAALFMIAFMGLFTALYWWIGRGLRRLDRSVRTGAILMSVFGLIGFPLGTLINAYFLYLLAGEKGKRVLSPEYQQIVAMTPHIRYKSPWALILLIVILLFAGIVVLVALSSGR